MLGWTRLQRVDIDSSYALVDRRHFRRPRCVSIGESLALRQGLRGAQGGDPWASPGRIFAAAGGVPLRAAQGRFSKRMVYDVFFSAIVFLFFRTSLEGESGARTVVRAPRAAAC